MAASPVNNIIDAHHHLWRYNASDYAWISPDMASLQRNFLPADLEQEMSSCVFEDQSRITGSVVVQARQSIQETQWLLDLADAHQVTLVGGDTTRGPLTVSVQILGHVPRGTALLRGGAQPGDLLVVTGTLGDAGAGLNYAKTPPRDPALAVDVNWLVARFEYPTPRVAMGMAARGIASAAMDISDGLAGDLPKLARASGLHAHVAVEKLPVSPALHAVADPAQAREWASSAGDDYELLLTVAPPRYVALQAQALRLNLTLSIIGEMRAGAGVSWSLDGIPFAPRSSGFDHFG